MICPFMSNPQLQCRCRTDCGLYIKDNCAIRVIAQTALEEKSEVSKTDTDCVNHLSNSDMFKNS